MCWINNFLLLLFNQNYSDSINLTKNHRSTNDASESILMNWSINFEHNYSCQSNKRKSDNHKATRNNITSSPLHSSYISTPFDNSLSPIDPHTYMKVVSMFYIDAAFIAYGKISLYIFFRIR